MHQEIHKHIELLVFTVSTLYIQILWQGNLTYFRDRQFCSTLFQGQTILPYHHTKDQTKRLTFLQASLKSL